MAARRLLLPARKSKGEVASAFCPCPCVVRRPGGEPDRGWLSSGQPALELGYVRSLFGAGDQQFTLVRSVDIHRPQAHRAQSIAGEADTAAVWAQTPGQDWSPLRSAAWTWHSRIGRQVHLQRRPFALPARRLVAGVHREPTEPGVPGIGVTECAQVSPCQQECILKRILGAFAIAQDEVGDTLKPGSGCLHQL